MSTAGLLLAAGAGRRMGGPKALLRDGRGVPFLDRAVGTLLARLESAGPGVARALEIEEGDRVVHWQRLRLADGIPMCIEDAYLADSIVPRFLDQNLPESLYAELQRRDLLPTWGEDSIESARASADEAVLLDVAEGDPVLRIARRAFAGNVAVEVSRSTYRADRFTLWVPLSRPGEVSTEPAAPE